MKQKNMSKLSIYLHGNDYYVINEDKLYPKLSISSAKVHFVKRYSQKDLRKFPKSVEMIDQVVFKIDFFNPSSVKVKDGVLTSTTNPSESWTQEICLDEEIIKEYSERIMQGVEKDLVKLIIYSMRYREEKLNKLLLIGRSNKGKTALMKLMSFIELSARDFIKVLDGGKWSQVQSDRLMRTGLLLADDILHDLPITIKNVTDKISIDIMHKGPIEHPCKFLVMTSTHDSVARTVNDELRNRILCMNIGGDFTFNDSNLRRENPTKYIEHTEAYIKGLILEAIKNDISTDEFSKLQSKYRLSDHNERDEILENVSNYITDLFHSPIGKLHHKELEEYLYRQSGKLYIKKISTLKKLIKEKLISESDGNRLDIEKEVELLSGHFIMNRTSLRIGVKVVNYYELNEDRFFKISS